jgi:hypothetical protein
MKRASESKPETLLGDPAIEAWINLSPQVRDEIRHTLEQTSEASPPGFSIFIVDSPLPEGSAALITVRSEADSSMLVLSRSNTSDAVFAMTRKALAYLPAAKTSKGKTLSLQSDASVVIGDEIIAHVNTRGEDALRMSPTLDRVLAAARSVETADLPKLGRGKLYRY